MLWGVLKMHSDQFGRWVEALQLVAYHGNSSEDFVVDMGGQSKVDPKVAFATERSIPILIREVDWGAKWYDRPALEFHSPSTLTSYSCFAQWRRPCLP